MIKNPPANAGDGEKSGSIPGLVRSPEGEDGNPLQYSCFENSMDRGAWKATSSRGHKAWNMTERLGICTHIEKVYIDFCGDVFPY